LVGKSIEKLSSAKKKADISLSEGSTVHVIVEVKNDWKMSSYDSFGALKQAYSYALEQGARDVVLTNGDWYALYDRTKGANKGLKLEENFVGQFHITALEEKDKALIQWLTRENVLKRHRTNSAR
jgi:predicted type IV restriction endonuclease